MPPERSPKPGPESLETRLRRLPPPPVPADLESKLLAAIPAGVSFPVHNSRAASGVASAPRVLPALTQPGSPGRWVRWIGGVSALAAACLLIVLAWPKGQGQKQVKDPKENGVAAIDPPNPISPRSPQGTATPWLQARRAPDDLKLAPFTWPIEETRPMTAASSIPSDLLD